MFKVIYKNWLLSVYKKQVVEQIVNIEMSEAVVILMSLKLWRHRHWQTGLFFVNRNILGILVHMLMIVLWELLYRWVMLDSFASMNKPVLLALNNFFGSHWDSSSEISTTDKCYTTNRFSLKISSLLNAGLALALEQSSYL